MRFAKLCFTIAGWWGLLLLTSLLFAFDAAGVKNPPEITHPEYYYGFLCVALAWQVGFLVIGRQPIRYCTMMLPAMIEKFGYALCCFVLAARHLATATTMVFGGLDLVFGTAFFIAWRRLAVQQEEL